MVIVPTLALPPGMQFTYQPTPKSVVPDTAAVKVVLVPASTVAVGGITDTATVVGVTVTRDAAEVVPSATATAVIETGFGVGTVVGAL